MINEEVLSEKLKYLIIMNAKPKQFEIMSVYVEFNYADNSHEKLESYDIDVKFDYGGAYSLRRSYISMREVHKA